ncbi:MAG: N-acetylmuramoyl-L-alanine amidase [Desulfobacterales bacterium]
MCKKNLTVCMFLLVPFLLAEFASLLHAAGAEQQYAKAEAHYRNFVNNTGRTKYRDQWVACIGKYDAVYNADPSGAFAPASLYMSGKLRLDLYRRSEKSSDRQEGLDKLRQMVSRFPDSSYRKNAEDLLRRFPEEKNGSTAHAPDRIPHVTAKTEKKKAVRETEDTEAAPKNVPFKARKQMFKTSKAAYRSLAAQIPAEDEIAQLLRQQASSSNASSFERKSFFSQKTVEEPIPVMAKQEVKLYSAKPTVVNGLRFWSNPNYTRIVVDGDRDTDFTHELLPSSANIPQRLYIDFHNSLLGNDIQKAIPIDDDLLRGARAAQYTTNTVRVVIDIKSFKSYKIFSLKNPFRTIIDIWGQDASITAANPRQAAPASESRQTASAAYQWTESRQSNPQWSGPLWTEFRQAAESRQTSESPQTSPVRTDPPPRQSEPASPPPYYAALEEGPKITPHDLARQLALGVRRIVIDPGHGGHDVGAPGFQKGVYEKDVVLQLSLRLAEKIRRELGCEVIMTRSTDRYLTLEERTAIANTKNADLFVSIHCNASKNRGAYGIETYFLNLATDEDAILVAARENATSRKNISDLQTILTDLMKNAKINESSKLAAHVQKSMCNALRPHFSNIKNKGVKQAPFYVLLGAQMPSILVETSFISNKRECERLTTAAYQDHLCNAIVKGIVKYVTENSPTAFMNAPDRRKGKS